MQDVSTTDTIDGCDGCVNTPTSCHLCRLLRRLALHAGTLPIPSVRLWVRLLLVWQTVPSFLAVVSCFTNFVILCTPLLHVLSYTSSLLRVHPSLLLVSKGVLPLTGAPLDDFSSRLF